MNDAPPSAADAIVTGRSVKLDARELELARLSDGSVVVKRGVREVLLRDPAAGALLEELAELLDGTRTVEALLAAVEVNRRDSAVQLLKMLVERRLLGDAGVPDTAEARFWATFGAYGASAPERLGAARVTVLGGDTVARGLVAQLLACGVGTIDLIPEPALISREDTEAWLAEIQSRSNGDGRVHRVDPADASGSVAGCTLLCAASDDGQSAALTDANREALAAEVPFLPVWVAELIGYIGPASDPFDTACLRCYQLRAESNSGHPDIVRALREQRERNPTVRDASGLLPPMAAAVSAVAAMEAVKRITRFTPCDAVGRVIEVNLVSFTSRVRRVLKLPRCPDCSDVMRRRSVALARGPQVPGRL
jgi:bacteriocin biosynthesis cyclodehydratase domain-containing protein